MLSIDICYHCSCFYVSLDTINKFGKKGDKTRPDLEKTDILDTELEVKTLKQFR